jgi:hypothetical protein
MKQKTSEKDLSSFDWTLRQGSGLRLNQAGFLCLDYDNNGKSGGNYKIKFRNSPFLLNYFVLLVHKYASMLR